MRIIFFGTTHFSAYILASLLSESHFSNHEVVAVVTKTDRPAGRSLKLQESAVKRFLKNQHPEIPLYQPEKVSTEEFEKILRSYNPDIFIVVAFGEIIKQRILDIPPRGCFNIHASYLPKYRGAAPIQRAILAGEQETGITIIRMVLKMDAGPIVFQKKITINEEDRFDEVEKKLMTTAVECLQVTIAGVVENTLVDKEQEEGLATYADKITPEDYIIHWDRPVKQIINQVRALPGAYTLALVKGEQKRIKILRARILNSGLPQESKCGMLICIEGKWCCAASDGLVWIEELQLEGKPIMQAKSFFNGYAIASFGVPS